MNDKKKDEKEKMKWGKKKKEKKGKKRWKSEKKKERNTNMMEKITMLTKIIMEIKGNSK